MYVHIHTFSFSAFIPANMLSRNTLTQFSSPGKLSSNTVTTSTPAHHVSTAVRLGLPLLQMMLHRYCHHGISPVTRVTYSCGQQCYLTFCNGIHQDPLPTTESILLLFVSHLATFCLSCATIKVYISAIWNF